MPTVFYRTTPFKVLVDNQGHKKRSPGNLATKGVVEQLDNIQSLLDKQYMKSTRWEQQSNNLYDLKASFERYVTNRVDTNNAMQQHHQQTAPSPDIVKLTIIDASQQTGKSVKVLYAELNKVLEGKDYFEPVNVYEMAPIERSQRFRFINGLALSFRVHLYRVTNKNTAFVWKIPENNDSALLNESLKVTQLINADLPKYHTRSMQKKAVKMFKNVRKFDRVSLLHLYTLITNDESVEKSAVNEKIEMLHDKICSGMSIEQLFEEEECEKALDGTKFNNFFTAAQQLLDDHSGAVPDERRHGESLNRSPLFVSLRDFHKKTERKMLKMFEGDDNNHIPSLEWFRLQLMPQNKYANIAKAYTGRLKLKWRLQQRLLRKFHVDHHYGAKVFQYFKELAQT